MPFLKVQKNIAKAQIHRAKSYNNCQASNKPFEVSQKVLKVNLDKLRSKYVGPYIILSHDSTGNRFFLKDRHSHILKKSVPQDTWLNIMRTNYHLENVANHSIKSMSLIPMMREMMKCAVIVIENQILVK